MNSAQRRRAQREFPYSVVIAAAPDQRYFEHDRRVVSARQWCRRQFKLDNWRCASNNWDSAEFRFVTQRDATLFALRWAS
jgi:hypothetical protein